MSRNYNIMALQGYTDMSDQDFVEEMGMPQELAFKPDMNLWMTYCDYLKNKKLETPEETERLLMEQFMQMRIIISPRIWVDMDVFPERKLISQDGEDWWMNDSDLMEACKQTYGRYKT